MGTCKETLREKLRMRIPNYIIILLFCATVTSAFVTEDLYVSFGSPAAAAWKIPDTASEKQAIQINIHINQNEMKLIQGHVKSITSKMERFCPEVSTHFLVL